MEITIPKTSDVMSALLKADYTTLWRNRRAALAVLIIPIIIIYSWKNLVATAGGAFVLSNSITLGLVAIGLMGYANSIARDRDKGVFQRLRVSPLPLWTIMASRLLVQLSLILMLTIVVFIAGYEMDHITVSFTGYLLTSLASVVGGAVYLALGQAIVGRIENPETVNATVRLLYFVFIVVGLFGEMGVLGDQFKNAVNWSPYGTVKNILAASLEPARWNNHTSLALLLTMVYSFVFAVLGIRWFKWSTN